MEKRERKNHFHFFARQCVALNQWQKISVVWNVKKTGKISFKTFLLDWKEKFSIE
jgi:hypothetical protein